MEKPIFDKKNRDNIKNINKDAQLTFYKCNNGELKRNLSFNEINYGKKTAKKIYIIFFGWFFLTIFSGWILCYFTRPPIFFLNFYSNYMAYIKEHELFCMSMMVAMLTFPLAFWLLLCEFLKIAKSPSWVIRISLMAIALLLVFFTTGVNGLNPIGQGGGRKDLRTLIALLFDWQGAVLLNIFLFTLCAFLVATSLKPKEK